MLAPAAVIEEVTIKGLAAEANRKHPTDGKAAGELFERKVRKALGEVSAEPLISELIGIARRICIGDERHVMTRSVRRGVYVEGPKARGRMAIESCAMGLLDKDIDGVPLREWIGTELSVKGQDFYEVGMGSVRWGRFLKELGGIAGNSRVGQKVTEAEAKALLKKHEHATPLNGNGHANGNGKNGNRG